MKHTILHHLGMHHKQVSNAVKNEIEKATDIFNFETKVRESIHNIINNTIELYFKSGTGMK